MTRPAFLVVGWGHVMSSGLWIMSRRNICHFWARTFNYNFNFIHWLSEFQIYQTKLNWSPELRSQFPSYFAIGCSVFKPTQHFCLWRSLVSSIPMALGILRRELFFFWLACPPVPSFLPLLGFPFPKYCDCLWSAAISFFLFLWVHVVFFLLSVTVILEEFGKGKANLYVSSFMFTRNPFTYSFFQFLLHLSEHSWMCLEPHRPLI